MMRRFEYAIFAILIVRDHVQGPPNWRSKKSLAAW